jgi:Tfp pilus assembly protein PilF
VAALSAGNTSVQIGSDLDYTLRAFPNHHRALLAMQRLGQRLQTPQPPGASVPVECYFERALRFRPHDITARLLYAKYLFQNRRDPQAQSQMQQVDAEPDADGMTHYNMGLIFLEQRHFLLAREQARKAYAMDVDAPALREQLLRQGWWP